MSFKRILLLLVATVSVAAYAQTLTCTNPKIVFSEDFTFFSKDSCTALSNILDGQIHTNYDIDDPPADRTWTHYVIDSHCLVVNTAGAGGWWINNKPVRKGNTGNEGKSIRAGLPEHDGFLLVNCADELGDMFAYTLPDESFCPNTNFSFTADITNLGNNPSSTGVPVNVSFIVLGLPGNVELLRTDSGDLRETSQWINVGGTFNSGNFTSFKLIIRNNILTGGRNGNDAGIDNIVFSGCIPDPKVTSAVASADGSVVVCDKQTDITFNDSDLRQYFTQPYYLLQSSTNGTTWENVGTVTTNWTFTVNTDAQPNNVTYYYRVWAGGNESAVIQSAQTGQAGSCTDFTAVSKPISITRSCTYTKSQPPVTDDFTECAGTTPSGKLDLTTLVTDHKDKLTWYVNETGSELLESTVVSIAEPGVYTYYVTNTESGYTLLESDRVKITVTIKEHIRYTLDKSDINECMIGDVERSFNILNPSPTDATFEWYNGTTLLGTGLKYTLENIEGSGTITIKATDASGSFCATPDKQVKYELSAPASAELKASPLAVYIGKTEVTVTASNVEGNGKYTLYKDDNEVLSGTAQEGKDITYTDKDFTTEGMLAYKLSIVNGLCSFDTYTAVNVLKDSSSPEPFTPDCPNPIEPMAFVTPNGDGLNDLWQIKHIECYGYYVVEIYDRFNKCLVKATGSYEPFSWDGTYNGHYLRSDDYWYVITIQEGDVRKQRTGHFSLKK